jgi:hypothetical protein
VGEEIDILKDARELFPWTDHQKSTMKRVYDIVYDGEEEHDSELAEAIWNVLQGFIFHRVGGEKFKSGLVHFTAVLGIDEGNGRLKEAINFSYVIAGLVWDIRIFAMEILMPRAQRDEQLHNPAIRETFLHHRQHYLADGTGTAMGELISLLAYGKHVALNTSNAGSITWSRDKATMYFHGLAIPLSAFQSMVRDNIERGEELLWRELLWIRDESDRFTNDLHVIEDDVTFTRRGTSFLTRENNHLQRVSHNHDNAPRYQWSIATVFWLQRL